MLDRFSGSMPTVAIAAASAVISFSIAPTSAQAPVASGTAPTPALTTPWGEPDLQGIWTVEYDTPLQRSPRFVDQEFFTEAQRAEFDRARSQERGRDERGARGSELDVAGAYNDALAKKLGASEVEAVMPFQQPGDVMIFGPSTPHGSFAALDKHLWRRAFQAIFRPTAITRWGAYPTHDETHNVQTEEEEMTSGFNFLRG